MRNQHLVDLAEQCIGKATAKVYERLLLALEDSLIKYNDVSHIPDEGELVDLGALPRISTKSLVSLVQDLPELGESIGYIKPEAFLTDHSLSVDSEANLEEGEGTTYSSDDSNTGFDHISDLGITNNDDNQLNGLGDRTPDTTPDTTPKAESKSLIGILRQHLFLLAKHPHRFLHHVERTAATPELWAIPFPSLCRGLVHKSLLQVITARFGPLAGRLTRILCDNKNNKLDEKTLVMLSLIPQKTMRAILHSMYRAGHLELQELPRDNQRKPTTTMFFWYFDPERCKSRVLEDTYQAMVRCLQRANIERKGVKATIEKASRTDVVGREDEFLSKEEKEALNDWKIKEKRFWCQVSRLDELIAVLRDF